MIVEPHAAIADEALDSWVRMELRPALRGEGARVEPCVLEREDGRFLFYRGRVNGLHGESGAGKTFVAQYAVAQEVRRGEHVVIIDFEDDEQSLIERLRDVFGLTSELIEEQVHYFRPIEPFDDHAVVAVEAEVLAYDASLVVIDSVGEAFGLEGIDEDRDAQVGPWFRRVARRLADSGPAVVPIDHATKARDNPLYPSGSKRKRAAITGAAYLIETVEPLTRSVGGRLRIVCAKDRHGWWRRGDEVATFVVQVCPDGGMSATLLAPTATDSGGAARRDEASLMTIAAVAVSAAKEAGVPLSQRELVAAMNRTVKASRTRLVDGIARAIALGAIAVEPGSRRAELHTYVHDLDAEPSR